LCPGRPPEKVLVSGGGMGVFAVIGGGFRAGEAGAPKGPEFFFEKGKRKKKERGKPALFPKRAVVSLR